MKPSSSSSSYVSVLATVDTHQPATKLLRAAFVLMRIFSPTEILDLIIFMLESSSPYILLHVTDGASGPTKATKGKGEGKGKATAKDKGGVNLDRCGNCDAEGALRACKQCGAKAYCGESCQRVSGGIDRFHCLLHIVVLFLLHHDITGKVFQFCQ